MNDKPVRTSAPPAPTSKPVFDPWQISTDDLPNDPTTTAEEKLWFALNFAVLAPSNHNTQPWRFRIHGLDVDLLADRTRRLPVTDPKDRELTISCGAALFHLRLALNYFGHEARVELLPSSSEPDLLARVHMGLRTDVPTESILLFLAIQKRHTNRRPFRSDALPQPFLEDLQQGAVAEGSWVQILPTFERKMIAADLVAEADREQWSNKAFRNELASWVRPASDPRHSDGLPVSSQDLGSLMSHAAPLAIRTFDLGRGRAAKDREIALYSPVLAVIGTQTDDPPAWLATGQALAITLLRAQMDDISASFLNQTIEVAPLRARLREALELPGYPQILLRLGYAEPAPAVPRRPVSAVLVSRQGPSASNHIVPPATPLDSNTL